MSSVILPALAGFYHEHPVQSIVLAVAGSLAGFWVFLLQYFKPAGKRRTKDGRKPRLPPGPKGLPLLGNLTTLRDSNRMHTHRLSKVSQWSTCPMLMPCDGFIQPESVTSSATSPSTAR